MQHRDSGRKGFVGITFALMLVALIGFTGLAVDVGFLQFEKRKLQVAADAAAMGALREMERGNTDYTTAAQNDASLNGFTNGVNNTTVTVATPPTSGTYSGDDTAIQVSVSRVVPTFFMQIFGQTGVTISSSSVARSSSTEGSIGGCIYAMDPTDSASLKVDGNVIITTACSSVVNSNNSGAFVMSGGATWNLTNGAEIGVLGPGVAGEGWTLNGSQQIINSTTGAYENPVNLAYAVSDPLASVSAPTPSGLNKRAGSPTTVAPSTTQTLYPGIYCGGIDVKGTASFISGTYVLAGGGLQIESQAVVSDTADSTGATGEMFYNTTSDSDKWGCPSGKSYAVGPFTFNGGATINLSAQTHQSPVGVLLFDDRTNATGLTHTINGNSTSTFDGALYFLNSYLKFAGTNKVPGFLFIVADTVEVTGTSNLGNDHSTLTNVYTLAPSSTGGGLVQ